MLQMKGKLSDKERVLMLSISPINHGHVVCVSTIFIMHTTFITQSSILATTVTKTRGGSNTIHVFLPVGDLLSKTRDDFVVGIYPLTISDEEGSAELESAQALPCPLRWMPPESVTLYPIIDP